jgi:hypothetical protein
MGSLEAETPPLFYPGNLGRSTQSDHGGRTPCGEGARFFLRDELWGAIKEAEGDSLHISLQ